MKKGDIVVVNKVYSDGKKPRNTRSENRTIDIIYDDGRVQDNVGDIWEVSSLGGNRFYAER